jgi:putative ABC transport system permease protein
LAAAISLLVSTIMIAIITYVSVIERTKEIGILRSVGARKQDISSVFNAETLIIGLVAGALGIAVSYLLTIPINMVISNLVGIDGIAALLPIHAILLILGSMLLTLIAGLIPARMAAKKDPVVALRTE